jgi:hypothetical protein
MAVVYSATFTRGGLDPRNLLIDADPTDNLKEVSGRRDFCSIGGEMVM